VSQLYQACLHSKVELNATDAELAYSAGTHC